MRRTDSTIGSVFLTKLRGLGRDESGVALVVTLAFVMPMLILVTLSAGISDMARRKVRLQNSVDMAARSAAVVQADLLSKMAIVNRVTAWTYANYCRRRMDWIMGAFCERCVEKWTLRQIECAFLANTRGRVFPNLYESNSAVGQSLVNFEMQKRTGHVAINPLAFKSFLNINYQTLPSVTLAISSALAIGSGTAMLRMEIMRDHAILEGTQTTWNRLRDDYKTEIRKAAEDILKANFLKKGGKSWGDYFWRVDFNDDKLDKVFKKLGSSEADERTLFEMAWLEPYSKSSYAGKDVLGAGADTWFVRDTTADHPKRVYRENNKFLKAEFDWAWFAWGQVLPTGFYDLIRLKPKVRYVHYNYGTETVKASDLAEVSMTGNGIIYRDAPVTAYTLKDDFWTDAGAITVAAQWEMSNPFSKLAPGGRDRSSLGIFTGGPEKALDSSFWSVLNPTVGGSTRPGYAMAIASARAGYKRPKRGQSHRQRIESTRYCLHPMADVGALRWNLCETDWDGLLIPAVAARSKWRTESLPVIATQGVLALMFENPAWHKNENAYAISLGNLLLPAPRMNSSAQSRSWLTNRLQWLRLGKQVLH